VNDPGALPKDGCRERLPETLTGQRMAVFVFLMLRCAADSALACGTPRLELGVAGPVFGSSATVVGLEGGRVKTSLDTGQARAL
jgi:hypothetical protein